MHQKNGMIREIDQREARTAGRNHFFHPERSACRIGEHDKDKIEKPYLLRCNGFKGVTRTLAEAFFQV